MDGALRLVGVVPDVPVVLDAPVELLALPVQFPPEVLLYALVLVHGEFVLGQHGVLALVLQEGRLLRDRQEGVAMVGGDEVPMLLHFPLKPSHLHRVLRTFLP